MISEKDKTIILKYARKYNLTQVILFGSSIVTREAADKKSTETNR